jgi:hypothetical protein
MAQKKTKAQKAADKAFIDKIKTIGINVVGVVKVAPIDGPCPVCSDMVPEGPMIGLAALPVNGKIEVGPVYASARRKNERPTEEQSFSA